MKRVMILMSTYNGERYLREQVDSILAQEGADVTLFVRDDGSSDTTPSILRQYANEHPGRIVVEYGDNCGCRKSFFTLIKTAAEKYVGYDYYAFADQDDVWLPTKVCSGVAALDKEHNPYRVYYCDPMLVDEHLNPIGARHYRAKGTLEESFILQPCIGCSMMLSPAVLNNVALSDPNKSDIHDTWTYRVNLQLGGVIIQDDDCKILYRQHSSNCIGGSQTFRQKWRRRIAMFGAKRQVRSMQAREMLRVYGNEIPHRQKETLETLVNYKHSLRLKLKILFSRRFRSNSPLHNWMFRIAILTNRI